MKKISLFVVLSLLLSICLTNIAFAQGESGAINSAQYGNTYVIKNDSSLWGWGGEYTGNGNKGEQVTPIKILENVRSVSAGNFGSVAVKKDDTLWGWGYMLGGYAAGESSKTYLSPVKLSIDDVKIAASGKGYILALKNDNTLWVCGDMYTGDGTDTMADGADGFKKVTDRVIDMYAGKNTVYFIKEDNTLWGYGNNSNAQLGNMTTSGDTNTSAELSLTKILDDVKYVTACPDGDVVFAIRLDNSLYGWGNSGFYAEGQGWVEDAGSPYKIMDNVKNAAVDGGNAFIVKTDNTLWGWGYSYEGKTVSSKQSPYKITDNVISISLGERHASVLKTDNSLWTMGGNYRGGLGYNSDETWYTPLKKIVDNVQDAPASWATKEVEDAIGAKLIPENMQNNYTKPITREEFCILAIRMIEVKADMSIDDYLAVRGLKIAPNNTFVDCTTKDVLIAKALGITDGTSPTEFSPNNLLTREQAAKFLSTTAIACGREINLSTPSYADVESIANWAKPYTGYVYDINVMKGVGGNRFDPKGSYQRQQAFMTMHRIWKSIDKVSLEKVEMTVEEVKFEETLVVESELNVELKMSEVESIIKNQIESDSLTMKIEGTSVDSESNTALEYDVYYKNANVKIDTYWDGKKISNSIYNTVDDKTYTEYLNYTHYAEVIDGNMIPIRLLNLEFLNELEILYGNGDFTAHYETLNGEKVLYIQTSINNGITTEFWYSTKYIVPIKFREIHIENDGTTSEINWSVISIDESSLDDSIFDIPDDAEPNAGSASEYYGDEDPNGSPRGLLLYEVKTIASDEAGIEGMMTQIVYYSDSSYELLVAYFNDLLSETDDYSLYVQEGRTSIDGTINGELVIVIINDFMTTKPEVGMNGVNINFYE